MCGRSGEVAAVQRKRHGKLMSSPVTKEQPPGVHRPGIPFSPTPTAWLCPSIVLVACFSSATKPRQTRNPAPLHETCWTGFPWNLPGIVCSHDMPPGSPLSHPTFSLAQWTCGAGHVAYSRSPVLLVCFQLVAVLLLSPFHFALKFSVLCPLIWYHKHQPTLAAALGTLFLPRPSVTT